MSHVAQIAADTTPTDPTGDRVELCRQRLMSGAAERTERRLQALAKLTEIGMELAQAVQDRLHEAEQDDAAEPDIGSLGLVFSRVSRAVRQTIALDATLDADFQASLNGQHAQQRRAEDAAIQSAKTIIIAARRQTILGALHTAIEAHYQRPGAANAAKPMYGQPPDRDWLAEELADEAAEKLGSFLDKSLKDSEYELAFGTRPIGEIVVHICKSIGASADPSLWADEDWAKEEMRTKPHGSPYADWIPPTLDDPPNLDNPPDDTEPAPPESGGTGPP